MKRAFSAFVAAGVASPLVATAQPFGSFDGYIYFDEWNGQTTAFAFGGSTDHEQDDDTWQAVDAVFVVPATEDEINVITPSWYVSTEVGHSSPWIELEDWPDPVCNAEEPPFIDGDGYLDAITVPGLGGLTFRGTVFWYARQELVDWSFWAWACEISV